MWTMFQQQDDNASFFFTVLPCLPVVALSIQHVEILIEFSMTANQ